MARILFLNHFGIIGGAELALLDVALAYRESCTVVLLIDGPFRAALEAAGVRVVVLPSRWARRGIRARTTWPGPRSIVEAARIARSIARLARGHDLLYANSQKTVGIACAAGFLSRRATLWHLHDLLDLRHFSRLQIGINVCLANGCVSRVLANSGASASAFVRCGGRAAKVHVVYYGIDPAPLGTEGDPEAATLRRDLGLESVPVLGLFGRVTPWKGQHVLVEALTELPGVHALLVGEPFGEEGAQYDTALRRRVESLGIAERVHFLGFRRDVPRLMRVVDIVLHTAIDPEPFGRVVVEGMLAGKPVIAVRCGGVPEIVQDGMTGLLVAPGDAGDLARAVKTLLERPDLARSLAAAGRAQARERFTLERMWSEIARHVDEVLSPPR